MAQSRGSLDVESKNEKAGEVLEGFCVLASVPGQTALPLTKVEKSLGKIQI